MRRRSRVGRAGGDPRSSPTSPSVSLRVLLSSLVKYFKEFPDHLAMNNIVIALCAAAAFARVYSDRIYFETDFQKEYPEVPTTMLPVAMAAQPMGTDLTLRQPQMPPAAAASAPQASSGPTSFLRPYTPGLLDRGVNALTLNMETLLDNGVENVVFSPLSIAGALSLVLLGAAGQTLTEIATFLGIKAGMNYAADGTDLIHDEIAAYFRRFQALTVSGTVRFANGVFIQDGLKVSTVYEKNVAKFYSTEVDLVDFAGSPGEAMSHINKWVANRTEGSIDKLLGSPLPPQTTSAFVNVIYFEGGWENIFSSSLTRVSNFYVSPSETVQVELMFNAAQAYYYQDLPRQTSKFKILGIPYKDSDLAMYFILPTQGPKAFLAGVTVDDLMNMVDKATLQECVYAVPKMKLESTLRLKEPLEKMGMKTMFTPKADLRGVAEGIWVDQVLQKVLIEVTETGTKAVAATVVSATRSGKPIVRLDRPFIFMIYSRSLRTVTFWGTVYRPEPFIKWNNTLRRH